MKILIFLKKWPGGVGVAVKNTARELQNQGHEVKVITREEDMGIYSLVRSIFPMRKKYMEIIKKENPDIIYTQDWSMALPLIFPTIKFRKKHFCCFHGNQSGKTKIIQTLTGKLLEGNLIVVGDSLKKRFPKSSLIYNGVDLKMFKPFKKVKKIKNSVGFVNWKTEEYNYEKIKRVCEKLGKNLIVAENVPYDKMPKFYNKLEMFVSLPPKYAGFNMSWVEAMACGVPKIIGNGAGVGNKLEIDKFKTENELIENINKVKSKNYRKHIENSDFTWETHVSNLLREFESGKFKGGI